MAIKRIKKNNELEDVKAASYAQESSEVAAYNFETRENNLPRIRNFGGYFMVSVLCVSLVQSLLLGYLFTKIHSSSGVTAPVVAGTAPNVNQPAAANPIQTADNVPKVTTEDKSRGNTNSRLILVEYSDLECPFCKQFHVTMKSVMDAYKNDVRWVYRQYPLSFHQNAQKEAEASECVAELAGVEAFWKFIDTIYEETTSNGTGFALDKLGPLAAKVGVNQSQFQQCLDSGKKAQTVADQMAGGTSAGVNGTPGTIIIDTKTGKTRLISGAYPLEEVKRNIDEMLQ
jgi:protein-disulfide isomerase